MAQIKVPQLSRYVRWSTWPAPVLNGISVGVGLALLTTLIGLTAGMPAAITAASGASTASVADTVCAPQAKRDQMRPAVISSLLVATLVALCHAHPLWMSAAALLVIFTSIFWMSWGKRGGPQTFVMVLTLVFQMAAFNHAGPSASSGPLPHLPPVWWHLGWVAVGAIGMALWAEFSIRLLAGRYRTIALADSLDGLANMMAAQATWTRSQAQPDSRGDDQALLRLVGQQAGIAEAFQTARDLLYSQLDQRHHPDATIWLQTSVMVHIVNLRDVVQACQLDLDKLPAQSATQHELDALATQLRQHADQLHMIAACCRRAGPWPSLSMPAIADEDAGDAILNSLRRRRQHMQALMRDIARGAAPEPLQADQRKVMLTLISPSNWSLAPLKAQLNLQSPTLRYAVRATLAVACAHALARALPWSSHPHWILMTVAVVMRGNLEQTLARRDARIQGTLVGCLIASAVLLSVDHSAWLFLVLVVALSLAHGFALLNYRVTAAAGAVLALVQGHLFSPEHHAALMDAAERLGDTVIGASLAWGFSYVLPSWERQQWPKLAERLLTAQTHYTRHALNWHEEHEQSPRRSHARREVYDVLWLLTQSLQRMDKEPSRLKASAPQLEMLIIHSHRFIGLLAAIRGLLTVRFDALDPAMTASALQQAEQRIAASFHLTSPPEPASHTVAAVMESSEASEDRSPLEDAAHMTQQDRSTLNAWLARRLHQAEQEARLLSHAARRLQDDERIS